jgi:hypothetical protein
MADLKQAKLHLKWSTTISKAAGNLSVKPVGVGAASQLLSLRGRTIWIADAHRGEGKRFVTHVEEELTAFPELAIRIGRTPEDCLAA